MGRKKILIIGGGVAGLSTGIYSQLNGFDSEIIEMHTKTGGQCTAWDRKGYRFDYCLHWLVGSARGAFYDIWRTTDVLNDDIKILNHDIFTRVIDTNGTEFIVYSDIDKWETYLLGMAPEDKKGIQKMCKQMKKAVLLESFAKPPGFRNLFDYLKVVPRMLPLLPILVKYKNIGGGDYINELGFKNERLLYFMKKLFTESGLSALALIFTLGWFHDKNAGYLIGGSLPIAQRMSSRYTSLGGNLTLGKKVSEIIVENNMTTGVILTDGTRMEADYIISAADGHATIFDMLKGNFVSEEIMNAYETWELFTPIVQVSFGIDQHIITDSDMTTYFTENGKIGSTMLKQGYSIMNHSAYDPTMAPEGKTTLLLRFESPWEIWESLEGQDYKDEKKRIEKDSLEIIEKHFPGIADKIEVIDIASPKTDVRYTGVWKGSYEGFLPSGDITRSIDMELPGLSNFFMVGQWLSVGGGLPPSAQSGNWVIQKICKKEKRAFKDRFIS